MRQPRPSKPYREALSVWECGDENNRDVDTRIHKVSKKLGSAHARHLHVRNETVRLSRPLRSKKCFSRDESLDIVSERFHETTRRRTNHVVIIHNGNYGSRLHRDPSLLVQSVWSRWVRFYCALTVGCKLNGYAAFASFRRMACSFMVTPACRPSVPNPRAIERPFSA